MLAAMVRLEQLQPGMPIVFGGDKLTFVSAELAERFKAGDRLIVVQESGELLHVPAVTQGIAGAAVERALAAFEALQLVSDEQLAAFFEAFARRLEDDASWTPIARANAQDVTRAQARGRSTTRLLAGEAMRRDMIAGLRVWRDSEKTRGRVIERVQHAGFVVEQLSAPLGVVGFVFEGRPNVFADAVGVLRTGNTVVFRIGSDALGTARAIASGALEPALREAGLPLGAASLVDSAEHAAGWALFADPRLALAVARGSGGAVAQLGAVARQAGTPVSLHGTGGAWLIADDAADATRFSAAVYHSLDRKVCNTLNVCCIVRSRAPELVGLLIDALTRAGERRATGFKLHVVEGDEQSVPGELFTRTVRATLPEGEGDEAAVQRLPESALGHEWEWENTPELTLKIVDDLDHAVALFNRYSPQFTASLISEDERAQQRFYETVNAPFVSDGFTRWVDGQYALGRPELGLANWEHGRLFARAGVLSGDGVFTVRMRTSQRELHLDRSEPVRSSGS